MGNLAGGLPHNTYFPYDTLEAMTALPERFKPTPNDPRDPPTDGLNKLSVSDKPSTNRILVPHDSTDKNTLRKIDITTALQYGTAQGYPALYTWLRQFTNEVYHPNIPYEGGAEIILDCGNTDGLSKVYEVFFNHWDRDRDWIREREGLLVEEFAYSPAVGGTAPRDVNIVPVAIDSEGMLAYGKGGLLEVMENWDFSKGKRPHLMYTVTMGQNPTSGLLSVARRKEIYKVCSEYDIIIVEDDPYWYLQFPSANALSMKFRGEPISQNSPPADYKYNDPAKGQKSSGFEFLDNLVPSYLSIDTDGRVIRLDTFSKTVAPGCRLGWITAQPAIIQKLFQVTESTTQQPSGFVQSLVAELLVGPHDESSGGKGGAKDGSGWRAAGWVRWLEGLRGNYERRMNTMATILEEGKFYVETADSNKRISLRKSKTGISSSSGSLSDISDSEDTFSLVTKTEMYTFLPPSAGMFLWLHVNIFSHPLSKTISPQRLVFALWVLLTQPPYLLLITPGSSFSPTPAIAEEKGYRYFRFCFAAIDEDKLAEKTKAFVAACRFFWGLRKRKDIDRILRDEEDEEVDGQGSTAFKAFLGGELGQEVAGREEEDMEFRMKMGHMC
ncbi:putative aromatic amino acid aminotransferase [Phaeomoniella chlamydospora]|uniref:Putative aromatic amino acid aminotransferase n=1 Tax=Phaeomoniella chlamydospora TaxID=158046 RepID=A0A0G2DZC6_PHACM|nr:putative aromatic amino acid aminotransferase [Phaeomoniella chlamydospora]